MVNGKHCGSCFDQETRMEVLVSECECECEGPWNNHIVILGLKYYFTLKFVDGAFLQLKL